MIERFQDPVKLVAGLQRQQVVGNDKKIAERLAAVSTLLKYDISGSNNVLITQDDSDNDIFFILAGRVSIWVNGKEVAIRGAGQHVGEMALIDNSAPRCATVRAIEQTVVAKIQEKDFTPIADKHPKLWRNLAVELGNRIRERGKQVVAPNPRPVVFIGSSKESLSPAREIQSLLSHDDLVARPWTDGFRPSATSIENLERELAGADFAILVLAADDVVESRKISESAPRDNVIWEHGFFVGGLGRSRTFIVKPRNVELKLPSDWGGITILDYDPNGTMDDLSSRLGSAVNSIRKEIARLKTKNATVFPVPKPNYGRTLVP
jgi:CRP/FNR family transcriptional regulator, cyclic AMP receptor protein